MRIYQVYHAKDPSFGIIKKQFPEDYEHIATVAGKSLNHVFKVTNNADTYWFRNSEVIKVDRYNPRSTSVGDVVVDPTGKKWLCELMGWKQIHIPPPPLATLDPSTK